jgi:glycosyltransferase involved in cell wall biosynthesis
MIDSAAASVVASERGPGRSRVGHGVTTIRHVITCEYPPAVGGVADHTRVLARALAAAGEAVHVWSPAPALAVPDDGVTVHQLPDRFGPQSFRSLAAGLDTCPPPRRIFVQWVPHGYGRSSLNVAFCWWAWSRARRRGDLVDLMVHEPYVPFTPLAVRQAGASLVHRGMLALLLGAAARVWLSTPSWAPLVERLALLRTVDCDWLPVPSPIEPVRDPVGAASLRAAICGTRPLVAHVGTYGVSVAAALADVLGELSRRNPAVHVLLLGRGSTEFAASLDAVPRGSVTAAGTLAADDLSRHLQAPDVFLQPYPDGLSARRTTMTALLAHGAAAVATLGTVTEAFWADSDAVVLVPAGDAAGFAAAADMLLHSDARRCALGARAAALHAARFDARHAVDALQSSAHVG